MIATAAIAMVSCADTYELKNDLNGNNANQVAISFETINNKVTKAESAENSGEDAKISLYNHHDKFAVWGFKDVEDKAYVFGSSTTAGTVVSGAEKTAAVLYTAEEAATKNASLSGAKSTSDVKTPAVNYTAEDISAAEAIVNEGTTGANSYSQDDVDAAQAIVTAGVGAEKTPAVNYTQAEADAYNATLTGAVKAGDIKTPATYAWSYSPIRFWDKNSNRYDFYAAAPITAAEPMWTLNGVKDATDATLVAKNSQAGYFTLGTSANPVVLADKTLNATTYSEVMKSSEQTNTDYMIANEKHVEKAAYGTGDVAFDFYHILSRLNITVKRGATLNQFVENGGDAADAKVEIKQIEVRNMLSTGTFDESKTPTTGTVAGGTTERWTKTAATTAYNSTKPTDVTDKIYVLQSLIMPQLVTSKTLAVDGKSGDTDAPYIYIEYTIGTDNQTAGAKAETYRAYYNLATLFGVTTADETFAFNEGWQNTLNITIDAAAITFTADAFLWDVQEEKDLDIE